MLAVAFLILSWTHAATRTPQWQDTPLMREVFRGDLRGVERLLQKGCEIDEESRHGWTALRQAANYGQSDIVRLLLQRGADPSRGADSAFGTTLLLAAGNNDAELVRLLLPYYDDLDAASGRPPRTPIEVAVLAGNEATVGALLKAGADVDRRSADRRTPMHLACSAGRPAVLRELIAQGGDVLASDDLGRTPVHYATSPSCLRPIVAVDRASLRSRDAQGMTPAHTAALYGGRELLTEFLPEELEAKCALGRLPAHWAARLGRWDIVMRLAEVEGHSRLPADVDALGHSVADYMRLGGGGFGLGEGAGGVLGDEACLGSTPPEVALFGNLNYGGGLVAAFWGDGLVLFSETGSPGKSMQMGRIDVHDVEMLRKECLAIGVQTLAAHRTVYAAPSRLVLRAGDEPCVLVAEEFVRLPGSSGAMATWTLQTVQLLMESLLPANRQPAPCAEVRGYDQGDPLHTDWLEWFR